MVDPLDFEITLNAEKIAVIRYIAPGDHEIEVALTDLVIAAADWLTGEQMRVLRKSLLIVADLAKALGDEIDSAQTTD